MSAEARPPNRLVTLLAREIARSGPISVARFMDLALAHPSWGYYRRRDPLGAEADFVTAPELSQAFGEIIGLWLVEAWAGLGRPRPLRLVELGPGRGTLMADLLRATSKVAGFSDGLRVHLVETSAPLRARQRERLKGTDVTWHDAFEEVPSGPVLLIANELFDALPVHQLTRRGDGWVERRIGLDESGRLSFRLADSASPLAMQVPGSLEAPPGTIAEVSPARTDLAAAIGARLRAEGGIALVIDYGAWATGPTGDTLQAVEGHAVADPLQRPGEVDLSTQVDFCAVAEAALAAGAAVYGPIPQGPFLRTFGIDLRVAQLLRQATPEQRRPLRQALFPPHRCQRHGRAVQGAGARVARATPPPPGFTAPTRLPPHRAYDRHDPSPPTHDLGPVPPSCRCQSRRAAGIHHGFLTRQGGSARMARSRPSIAASPAATIRPSVEANRASPWSGSACCAGGLAHRPSGPRHRRSEWPAAESRAGLRRAKPTPGHDRPGNHRVGVLSADCAPVLMADPARRRGGCRPCRLARGARRRGRGDGRCHGARSVPAAQRLRAAVGPCIAQASYEVGPELRQMFVEDDPSASDRWFRPVEGSDRLLLDLEGYVCGRLGRAGVWMCQRPRRRHLGRRRPILQRQAHPQVRRRPLRPPPLGHRAGRPGLSGPAGPCPIQGWTVARAPPSPSNRGATWGWPAHLLPQRAGGWRGGANM